MLNLLGLHVSVVLHPDIIFKIYILYVAVVSVYGLVHLAAHVSLVVQNVGVSSEKHIFNLFIWLLQSEESG